MKPIIIHHNCMADPDVCLSIPACSTGALSYTPDDAAPNGGWIQVDYALCNGCGVCAAECCGDAIVMEEEIVQGSPVIAGTSPAAD